MAPFESASTTGICATGRTRKLGTMPGNTPAKIRFLEPRRKPPFPLYTRSCGQLEIPARSAISRLHNAPPTPILRLIQYSGVCVHGPARILEGLFAPFARHVSDCPFPGDVRVGKHQLQPDQPEYRPSDQIPKGRCRH